MRGCEKHLILADVSDIFLIFYILFGGWGKGVGARAGGAGGGGRFPDFFGFPSAISGR